MIRVLLCLLLLIAYPAVTKETKKFSIYIFLLDDKEILNESLESFEPKVYCPRGEILEALDFKDRKKIGGGTLSYAQVLCHSNKGYISQTDYDVHGGTNKEWYLKNKEKLLSLHEYGKIFSGAYVNPKSTSMLLIPYSVDLKNFQLKLILEAAIKKGGDSAVFRFNQWKISGNQCELSNQFMKLILTKEGENIHLKVIKDSKYNMKDFDDTIWIPNTDPERRS